MARAVDDLKRTCCFCTFKNETAAAWEKVWNKCDVVVGGDRLG